MRNDDMDDMMRKAADEYELNHEMASDWNKVHAGIQQPEQPFMVEPKQKKRRRYLLFLWFLLIPALLIMTYKMNLFTASSFINHKKITETATTKKQFKKLNSAQQQSNDFDKNVVSNNVSLNHLQTLTGKNNLIIKPENKNTATQKFSTSKPIVYNNLKTVAPVSFLPDSKQKVSSNNPDESAGKISLSVNNLKENKIDKQVINNSNQSNQISKNSLNQLVIDTASTSTQTANIKSESPKNVSKDSTVTVSSKQKKKTSNYTRQAFTYSGVLANADVSFIKNQKTSSPGLGAGIIGGYHFKNGISIETGLVYDRKNYYTIGKYFNKDKLGYLQRVNLLAANGNCYMYEILLNVAYDFKPHKKFNWFVTAGVSSYLMHKEYYNFKYDYNGSYGEKGYDYYHTSKDWFAILNVGAGVNIQTSNKYFIKVQPYYKAPLSGVGIGSLPLSSAGVNFSLVRRIP